MISTGLNDADFAKYVTALHNSHAIRVQLTILNRNEDVVQDVPNPVLLSGSVDMDDTQDISRSCQMVLLDPGHKLHFDGGNPATGAMYADNFLQIKYGVYVDELSRWVDVKVFTGPLTLFERNGAEVTLQASGKESLGLDPHLVTAGYTISKGTTIKKAVKNVMGRLGEQKFKIDSLRGKLHEHRAVHMGLAPWIVIIGGGADQNGNPVPGLIDKTLGHQRLFYDGAGYLCSKNKGGHDLFTFDGNYLLSTPDYTYDIATFRNHVFVTGHKPQHSKRHHHGQAALPASHPLSPQSLARNGKPRQLVTFYVSDTLKSDEKCRRKAEDILKAAAQSGVAASFDTLPVPILEEGDFVKLDWENYVFSFPVHQWSLPLTSDQPMTIGTHRRVRYAHRRHKRHHRRHH